MVKAALGPDAVIIATREVSNGLFKSKEIEVTAAVTEPPAQTKGLDAQPWTSGPTTTRRYASAQAPPPLPMVAPKAEAARHVDVSDEIVRLRGALEAMQREMKSLARQKVDCELELPAPATALYAQLLARGVEDALAHECVRSAVESAPDHRMESLFATLRTCVSERLVAGRAPWLAEKRRRTIALVGPTGVGKTTTLAKIAARAIMESKLKVALITIDTYRIGASEQVMRYGEIMSVPTFVARDRVELNQALERSAGADLVLVDTAGRSMSEAVARQAEMLRSVEGMQLFLVVSAATGHRELAHAAERYRGLTPDRLIVTKIDEAAGAGAVLSASVRIGRPIVAVADGQRVPEDIHALNSAQLVDLVVGAPELTAHASAGGR
jgi:flagellar biosynthesis protein FlhF